MVRAFLLSTLAFTLVACSGGTPITDYSNRSVAYAWIDVSGIPGNRMTYFQMRNLMEPVDSRYYGMGYEKMGNGYLVWHNGFNPGRYEFSRTDLMTCAGPLCTNQVNQFDFGPLGASPVQTMVKSPGVYFAGCYALKRTKRGFFRPGEFDTRKASCGASKQAMLSVMLKNAPAEHPIVGQRIRAAMR